MRFAPPLTLHRPGLFITGTDTGVGKTLVSCAIAHALRQQHPRWHVGVSKPFSSGCRHDREGLVNEDAEALAHFADCRLPLQTINPIRFAAPLAPAVAAEQTRTPIDFDELRRSFQTLDDACDALLVEGVGGLLVPLIPDQPPLTVLDLIRALGLPVLIVTRASLGTLNHTALTADRLRRAGCRLAGLVVNGYEPDAFDDPAMATNRPWLARLTNLPVLATVPRVAPDAARPADAILSPDILDPIAAVRWDQHLAPARPNDQPSSRR